MRSTLLALFCILFCINTIQSQETYVDLKYTTEQKRLFFEKEYLSNKDKTAKKDSIILDARVFLLKDINNYFDAWTGTQWDFNGTSKIACGYFVTTVLQDIDFKIIRIKWA